MYRREGKVEKMGAKKKKKKEEEEEEEEGVCEMRPREI